MDNAKHAAQKKADVAEEYIDDVMITLKVKSALAGDLILRDSHIETATTNGVVILTGTVDSEQSLGRAMELASAQEHVKSVVTRLLVKASTPGSKK
jgi:hyperosmotically inducible protein